MLADAVFSLGGALVQFPYLVPDSARSDERYLSLVWELPGAMIKFLSGLVEFLARAAAVPDRVSASVPSTSWGLLAGGILVLTGCQQMCCQLR